MEELMRQRCLSLPHAYTRTHTHTHTRAIKLFLAREREHMSCIACLPACHLSNQPASHSLMLFTLYSFFRGNSDKKQRARHSVVVKALVNVEEQQQQ